MTNTKHVLAFGGGLDSTGLLAIHLNRDLSCVKLGITRAALDAALPQIDAVVFSDPGAEFKATYENVEVARQLCADHGLRFEVVRKDGETITQWLARNGTVPVMPGGPHTCSLKFKGEVMHKWAASEFAGQDVTWVIGIEADEGHRVTRFQAAKNSNSIFPLVTLGINRERILELVSALWPVMVVKSSCVFCPFMSQDEITSMAANNPEEWSLVRQVEADFQAASSTKHQAWLDAGKPLVGKGERKRAPKGMWRLDSYATGGRLFVKRVGGRMLSVEEWEAAASAAKEL